MRLYRNPWEPISFHGMLLLGFWLPLLGLKLKRKLNRRKFQQKHLKSARENWTAWVAALLSSVRKPSCQGILGKIILLQQMSQKMQWDVPKRSAEVTRIQNFSPNKIIFDVFLLRCFSQWFASSDIAFSAFRGSLVQVENVQVQYIGAILPGSKCWFGDPFSFKIGRNFSQVGTVDG